MYIKNRISQLFSSKKYFLRSLYLWSIVINLSFTFLIKIFYDNEIVITDPRFEKVAYNLIHNGTTEIKWGDGKIMLNPFEIQKGVYDNWYPIGYSLWLAIPLMTGEYYFIVRTLMQIMLFSFIPVMIFNIALYFFKQYDNHFKIAVLTSIVVSIYPIYLNFSLQGSDTGMITFLNVLSLYLFFKSINSQKLKYYIQLGLVLSILFLFRPIGLIPYFILLIIEFYRLYRDKINPNYIIFPLLIASFTIVGWGLRNLVLSGELNIVHSNVGYNLWLGNNEYTNQILKKRIGDGATIEDEIIPYFDKKLAFLKNLNEYEKDRFFKSHGIEFILNNPLQTIDNIFLKFIGYWSPLRVREGHWSDSRIKTLITFIFSAPILFLGLSSIITMFILKEYKWHREKMYLVFLIFFWMLPHLLFFSTTRFRIPTDFILILLSIDILLKFIHKFKKQVNVE